METSVVVALISSLSSLGVAGSTAVWSSRQNKRLSNSQQAADKELKRLEHRLKQQEKEEERRFEAAAELTRYRRPLLDAAYELGSRIDNIRGNKFLAYLDSEAPRPETAILSTLYRLARYFGTLELLYARVSFLEFEDAEETRAVASLLSDIGRGFATDRFDRSNGFETSRFMVWREEQRAIGEVATRGGHEQDVSCVGFATFVENYYNGDSKWFKNFVADLEQGEAEKSERLAYLQGKLAALVWLLDAEGRFTSKDWVARVSPTATTNAQARDSARGRGAGRLPAPRPDEP
jgi:hypothetical protein